MFEQSARWVNRLEFYPVIGSTNSYLEKVAMQSSNDWPDFSVVVADSQTEGKGRMERTWVSPAGASLSISILLRDFAAAAWSSPLAAVALRSTLLSTEAPPAVSLKWPNDLLIEDRKLAGILVRVLSSEAVVVGIGVNLKRVDQHVSGSISLEEVGVDLNSDEFLARLLASFRARYLRLKTETRAISELRAEYASVCSTIGKSVRLSLPGGGEVIGTAEGIDESGRLLVRPEREGDYEVRPLAFAAGDVEHLRNFTNE